MPQYTEKQEREFREFCEELKVATEERLFDECRDCISYCATFGENPNSNCHRMCEECYERCNKLGLPELYEIAWDLEADPDFSHRPYFLMDGKWDRRRSIEVLSKYKKQK